MGIRQTAERIVATIIIAGTIASCEPPDSAKAVQSLPTTAALPSGSKTPISTDEAMATATAPTETLAPTSRPEYKVPEDPGIMFLGDSLIALGAIPTYMAESLAAQGITVHFVGDVQSAINTVPSEGHGGFDTKMMSDQLRSKNPYWTALNGTRTPKTVDLEKVDVAFLQLGTNDVANILLYNDKGFSIDINTYTIQNYKDIIDYLRSKNPNVRIVVSRIPPIEDPKFNKMAAELNLAYEKMIDDYNSKAEEPWIFITPDWADCLNPDKDLADKYHPNADGQKTMEGRFETELLQIMDVAK